MLTELHVLVAKATTFIDKERWLDVRKKYVTASQVAAIMGEHEYLSAGNLALSKLGKGRPFVENKFMWWGKELEDCNAHAFGKLTNCSVYMDQLWFAKGALGATLDGLWTLPEGHEPHSPLIEWYDYAEDPGLWVLEMKNSDQGYDELPRMYWWQLQTQMHVSGLSKGLVVVKVGGSEMAAFPMEYDEFAMAAAEEAAVKFMANLEEYL